jgi:NAD-dependent deacetylase
LESEPLDALIRRAARILAKHKPFAVLTGAGISAESGIPTFRGPNGLWRRFRAEDLATPEAFARNPKLVWEWYRWRLEKVLSAKPNPAHLALVEMERLGMVSCVITQNVDGLHQAAGQNCVVELHGSIRRARCTSCGFRQNLTAPPDELPPRCPKCGSLLRPDVVWFGEPVPEDAWSRAVDYVVHSKGLLVVGTSGVVMPAALLPAIAYQLGKPVVEVNVERSAVTKYAAVLLKGRAGEVLPKLLNEVRKIVDQS